MDSFFPFIRIWSFQTRPLAINTNPHSAHYNSGKCLRCFCLMCAPFNPFHLIVQSKRVNAECTYFPFSCDLQTREIHMHNSECKSCGILLRTAKLPLNKWKKKRFINQWHSFVNRHYFHRRWKIRVYNVSFEYVSIPAVSVRVEWKLSYIQQVAFAINFYILFDQCECHFFPRTLALSTHLNCDAMRQKTTYVLAHIHIRIELLSLGTRVLHTHKSDKRSKRNR